MQVSYEVNHKSELIQQGEEDNGQFDVNSKPKLNCRSLAACDIQYIEKCIQND